MTRDEQEVEELAIELWAVMDPLGTTKWDTLSQENQDFYKSRSRHFMSMGYRRQPTLTAHIVKGSTVVEAGEGVTAETIRKWWRFDDNQQPMSSWHDREDFIEKFILRKGI